jgi:membrane-bound lytic murein transglycosylase D
VKTEEQVAVKENDANEKLVFHTVQSGDTLWSIARKYQGVTVTQIREWNNLTNKQPLKVGQKIKVILPGT